MATGRRLALVAGSAVLTVVAVAVQIWIFVEHGSFNVARIASADPALHADWAAFHASAVALVTGTDIYATGTSLPNLNPPLLTVVMAPFGLLDELAGYRLFTVVTIVLVLGSVLAVVRELRLPAVDAGVALAAVLLSAPLLATLGLGQIYGLLTVALTVSWLAARRGMDLVEGTAVGLAVALKPSLAPLLLLPVVRAGWRTAAAGLAGAAAGTGVGLAVAGPSASVGWLTLVLDHPVPTYFDNASLPGTVLRLTSDNDWGRPLVTLPGGALVGYLLGAVLIAATLWAVRRRPGPVDLGLWALAAASLLASPVTWHTYLTVLVPATVIVLSHSRVAAAPLLALPLIGQEWPSVWFAADGVAPAVPLSLYCAILLLHWWVYLRIAAPVPAQAAVAAPRVPVHAV